MAMRGRKSANNTVRHTPRIVRAKFATTCSCGKSIMPGEPIFYDKWSCGPAKCLGCGQKNVKLKAQRLSEVQPTSEAQQIIDRIKQLNSLPKSTDEPMQSEIARLITTLKNVHSHDRGVMGFFRKQVRCTKPNSELVMIRAKFCGFCFHCLQPQKTGAIVLYDRVDKNLHCVECDCPFLAKSDS
jgi:hypothetical protein